MIRRRRIVRQFDRVTVDMRFGRNAVKGDTLRALMKRSSLQELVAKKREVVRRMLREKGEC